MPGGADWRTWLLLGGCGAGKTLAGAWFINRMASMDGATLALVGPTLHDVREVMIEGASGIAALSGTTPPRWEATRRRLAWKNGSVAYAFSAEDADSLRGPQFHAAWGDEFCAWKTPDVVLGNLRMGLRRGDWPRLVLTTTPRPIKALRSLMAERDVVVDRAGSSANAEHLSPGFLEHLETLYGGTRLAAQELVGQVVETDGALFRAEDLKRARGPRPAVLDRIVLAVDPPVTETGDACGLVVVGRRDERAYVLADASARGLSPLAWARRAVETALTYGVQQIVAEGNQGGEMVRAMLAQAECPVPVHRVHARYSKTARAQPVAALYEQGRVTHCGDFALLEEEMLALGEARSGERGGGRRSPDRADALVWAVTELLLEGRQGPRLRWI
ncbi:terminase large subunit domain-containing protein [Brevundimonas sp. Leaf363]|uniref:terminase large subunit domain-containing protein n=1 Tax=Brevundimonas sp. Leaf363 TaxID=1736353 RepID=UPI000B33F731|nr:terminase family protein [Brevundimonas sp. Leaf363]